MIDWDESHVDVPDLDLALPHNAAGLDDDAYDIAAQAQAAWVAAVCTWDPSWDRASSSQSSSFSPKFERSERQQPNRQCRDLRFPARDYRIGLSSAIGSDLCLFF